MANIYDPNFNKNVVEVYTEEPGFTGYKGLDWNKLDSIEDILTGVGGNGPNYYLSGIRYNTSGIKDDIASIDSKLFVTGDPFPAGVQGTIVFQADLSAQYDNVDIAGYAGANISGIYGAVSNNFPVFSSIELKYNGSNNNTGVFYKNGNGIVTRKLELLYDGSNNVTGVYKTDY
jgi:hypothetical protein